MKIDLELDRIQVFPIRYQSCLICYARQTNDKTNNRTKHFKMRQIAQIVIFTTLTWQNNIDNEKTKRKYKQKQRKTQSQNINTKQHEKHNKQDTIKNQNLQHKKKTT